MYNQRCPRSSPICVHLGSWVHSYGFRSRSNTGFVTGLVWQLLYLARSWGRGLLVSVQDVRTAFEAMEHSLISESLLHRGVPVDQTAVMMRELSGVNAVITLPGAGTTESFSYSRDGKQDGVETPDQWNAAIDFIMEPLVVSWALRGLRFAVDSSYGRVKHIPHAVWADNFVLFSTDLEMTCELSTAFRKHN